MDVTDAQTGFEQVFFPHMTREMARARTPGFRFAHYTSAEGGLKILDSGRMLLRNSVLMNDYSEVNHGLKCLSHAWGGPLGERLKAILRQVQPDLPEIIEANFNEQFLDVRAETYLLSVSEHGSHDPIETAHEDRYGRLSMWRAYAPKNGIAFVFRNTPFVAETKALQAFTSPVLYVEPEDFLPYFDEIVSGVERHAALLIDAGGAALHDVLINAFRLSVQSTKHPSFKEEREWRAIYSPAFLQRANLMTQEQLRRVPTEIMSINGVPQRVYGVPFENYPDEGFVGATVPELIERVLIGPSADGYAIAQAFVAELSAKGVADAHEKVWITGVPLRI